MTGRAGSRAHRLVPSVLLMSDSRSSSADGESSTRQRCPSCGARVRSGASWCSLCHGRLTSQGRLLPELVEEVAEEVAAEGLAERGPRNARPDGEDPEEVAEEVELLLSRLAAMEAGTGLPGFLELSGRGRGAARAALAIGGGMVTLGALLALLVLLGAVV